MLQVFLTPTHLGIVMEYAAGGDLFERVKASRLSEDEARLVFQQLISAVSYCHSKVSSTNAAAAICWITGASHREAVDWQAAFSPHDWPSGADHRVGCVRSFEHHLDLQICYALPEPHHTLSACTACLVHRGLAWPAVCQVVSCWQSHLLLQSSTVLLLLQGVCHRDLKLRNTLLDGQPAPRLKICDFGYSKVRGCLV